MSATASHRARARLPALHLGLALAGSLLAATVAGPSGAGMALRSLDPEPPASQSFAQKNPACAEWSDACFVCKRGDGGAAKCSTPGIACTGGEIVCRAETGK